MNNRSGLCARTYSLIMKQEPGYIRQLFKGVFTKLFQLYVGKTVDGILCCALLFRDKWNINMQRSPEKHQVII